MKAMPSSRRSRSKTSVTCADRTASRARTFLLRWPCSTWCRAAPFRLRSRLRRGSMRWLITSRHSPIWTPSGDRRLRPRQHARGGLLRQLDQERSSPLPTRCCRRPCWTWAGRPVPRRMVSICTAPTGSPRRTTSPGRGRRLVAIRLRFGLISHAHGEVGSCQIRESDAGARQRVAASPTLRSRDPPHRVRAHGDRPCPAPTAPAVAPRCSRPRSPSRVRPTGPHRVCQ